MPLSAQSWSPLEVTSQESAGCGPSPAADAAPGEPLPLAAPRILILDDDAGLLDAYSRILARLPSRPEVRIATCATRAMALLDAEPFALLITDLRMPRIDGFQVLLSARRRYPTLKTVAMTSMSDQQYRARAYASGIDFYTEKPSTPNEIRLFGECIDALLSHGVNGGGFRGIQSKSLMDIIQIECLSRNSSVLRITRGPLEGRVWIHGGDVVDAELQDLNGEEAFKQIFSWKTGHFEILPAEPLRQRTIYTSYESLLLDSAQSADESAAGAPASSDGPQHAPRMSQALLPLSGVRGVESLLLLSGPGKCESWGIENPEAFALWTQSVLGEFQALGAMLNAGPLKAVEALGPVRGVVLLTQGGRQLMAGIQRKLNPRLLRTAGRELAAYMDIE